VFDLVLIERENTENCQLSIPSNNSPITAHQCFYSNRETREIHEKLATDKHGRKRKKRRREEKNFDKKFLVILGALVPWW
jgi:hypothetical protein